jgi:cytochrome o ubiquinol oxidase subunit III
MSSHGAHVSQHSLHHDINSKTYLGFWIYLMTDLVLFASLFATFIVLRNNTFGGPGGNELFSLPFVLTETMILLFSSYLCGLAMLSVHANKRRLAFALFGATFAFGLTFLGLELHEFAKLYNEDNSWQRSGFLSAYFTLVGTHGLHITVGLLWLAVLGWQVAICGFTTHTVRRLTLFSLFWHFLDIVWIFIFTIVYLMGAL